MRVERRSRLLAGLSLIALGAVLYWFRDTQGVAEAAVYYVVGGVFLAFYFQSRNFGLLIAASILLGYGLGSVLDALDYSGRGMFLGIGLGFFAVWGVGMVYERQSRLWPMIPGSALVLLGMPARFGIVRFFRYVTDNWPLVLVVAGVVVLLAAFATPRRE